MASRLRFGLAQFGARPGAREQLARLLDPDDVGADRVSAAEDDTTGPGTVLTLRGTTGRQLVVLCASGPGWTWPPVVELAERQLARLPAQ